MRTGAVHVARETGLVQVAFSTTVVQVARLIMCAKVVRGGKGSVTRRLGAAVNDERPLSGPSISKLPGRDSNPNSQIQRLVCCQLHHPATDRQAV